MSVRDVPPSAQITLLDVHDRQVEMLAQLAAIGEQLKDLPDHETRIRALETARSRLDGARLLLSALAGGGAAWIALALHH